MEETEEIIMNVEKCEEEKDDKDDKAAPAKNNDVAYIYSVDYVQYCDLAPKVWKRASVVHELIQAYKLDETCQVVKPRSASVKELSTFHSEDYIEFLRKIGNDENYDDDDADDYGFGYDCPTFAGIFAYVCAIAGATLTAVDCLIAGKCNVVVNWGGGWHHTCRDKAAGFCYVNDIVIGILKLRTKYDRVLYVDLDVHHGDGVENAFAHTSKVMTVSFHKHSPGFYPGTGSVTNIGLGKGKYYTVNVPFHDGIDDDQYFATFKHVMSHVKTTFQPEVVVCQCGADGMTGDPVNSFNLTPIGLGWCIQHLLQWKCPVLFLGGGGYNIPNTACCWTYLMSVILGHKLPSDIPENKFFTLFGPGFTIEVPAGNRRNHNSPEYVEEVCKTISDNFHMLETEQEK